VQQTGQGHSVTAIITGTDNYRDGPGSGKSRQDGIAATRGGAFHQIKARNTEFLNGVAIGRRHLGRGHYWSHGGSSLQLLALAE
jgi:hypothetical protein